MWDLGLTNENKWTVYAKSEGREKDPMTKGKFRDLLSIRWWEECQKRDGVTSLEGVGC